MICMKINIECYDILMELREEKKRQFNPYQTSIQVGWYKYK